jgi:hypothetical protein
MLVEIELGSGLAEADLDVCINSDGRSRELEVVE